MHKSLSTAMLATLACSSAANAQLVSSSNAQPSMDRWMYPFNGSPGTRLEMSLFGATLLSGFDDHDAQVILGFDTSEAVAAGLGTDAYRLIDATITVTVSNDDGFNYDDTYDSYTTYGELSEPINDPDLGRPMNLYLVGYRDGFDQTTFSETTAFGITPDVPPAEGLRRAFAATYDSTGTATDISRHIRDGYDALPLAIGLSDDVTPGDLVPADTTFAFTFTPCDQGTANEIANMFDLGEVRFAVTSLNPANGGPDGGSGNYPVIYSSENPIAQIFGYTATLTYRVRVGDEGDFDGNGIKDFFDLSEFLTALGNNDAAADLDGNCAFDFFDLSAFLTAFGQ